MKQIILFLTIILHSIFSFSQQSIEVVYKASLGFTKLDKKSKEYLGEYAEVLSKKTVESTKRRMEILKDFNYILKANPFESLYYWEEETRDETVNEHDFISARNMGGGNAIHYQNKKENIYLYQFRDLKGKWQREFEPLDSKKWQITNETDTILGYPVIKAIYITKLNIKSPNPLIKINHKDIAWFTPAIPLPFGPAGIGGLPGLILKYHRGNSVIYATKIKFLKKNIKIKRPNKGALRSVKEATDERIKDLNKMLEN